MENKSLTEQIGQLYIESIRKDYDLSFDYFTPLGGSIGDAFASQIISILRSQDIGLSPEEFTKIMEKTNKVYELPGFTVTLEDTAKKIGEVSALCVEAVVAKASVKIKALEEENKRLREELAQAIKVYNERQFTTGNLDSLKEQEG